MIQNPRLWLSCARTGDLLDGLHAYQPMFFDDTSRALGDFQEVMRNSRHWSFPLHLERPNHALAYKELVPLPEISSQFQYMEVQPNLREERDEEQAALYRMYMASRFSSEIGGGFQFSPREIETMREAFVRESKRKEEAKARIKYKREHPANRGERRRVQRERRAEVKAKERREERARQNV